MPVLNEFEKRAKQVTHASLLAFFSGQLFTIAARVQRMDSDMLKNNAGGEPGRKQLVFPLAGVSVLTPEDVRFSGAIRRGGYRRLHEICAVIDSKVEVKRMDVQGRECTCIVVSLDRHFSTSQDAIALGVRSMPKAPAPRA